MPRRSAMPSHGHNWTANSPGRSQDYSRFAVRSASRDPDADVHDRIAMQGSCRSFSAQGTPQKSLIYAVFHYRIATSIDTIRGLEIREDVQVCAQAAKWRRLFFCQKCAQFASRRKFEDSPRQCEMAT